MSFMWIAVGTAVAGTAVSAIGSYQSGKQANQIAGQEAKFQKESAALNEKRLRFDAPRKLGTMKAILSKSGRSFQDTTGLDLISEAAGEIELDALITRAGGDIRAQSALSEGSLLEQRGKNQAVSTLLSGGSRIAGFFA